jgi:hypothetical protein
VAAATAEGPTISGGPASAAAIFSPSLAPPAPFDLAGSGGGKTGRKANADRVEAAKEALEQLRKQLAEARSKPNKTPDDKDAIERIEKAIQKALDRIQKSEEHAMKGQGQGCK